MTNEFIINSAEQIEIQQQFMTFTSYLQDNESCMSRLSQIMAIASPDPGSFEESVQGFVTRIVPVGKIVRMNVLINYQVVDAIPVAPPPDPEPQPEPEPTP